MEHPYFRLVGRISPKIKLPINRAAKVNTNSVHDRNSNPTTAATINEPLKNATFNFRLADMLLSSVLGNSSADFDIPLADFLRD